MCFKNLNCVEKTFLIGGKYYNRAHASMRICAIRVKMSRFPQEKIASTGLSRKATFGHPSNPSFASTDSSHWSTKL